jgi:hypothetical protein
MTVPFDNATIHNTRSVREHLADFGFKRMEASPHGSDLATCEFFIFGAVKQHFSGQRFESLEESSVAVETVLDGLSENILQTVFQAWVQ